MGLLPVDGRSTALRRYPALAHLAATGREWPAGDGRVKDPGPCQGDTFGS